MCLSILTPFPFLFMSLKKSSAVSLWSKAEVNKETDLKFAGVISDTESKNQNLKQGKFSNFNSNIFLFSLLHSMLESQQKCCKKLQITKIKT